MLEVVDDILANVHWQTPNNPATAKAIIDRLRQWSITLCPSLPTASDQTTRSSMSHQELTLANLQVTCSYYYGVILATRPFLSYQALQKQATVERTAEPDNNGGETSASGVASSPDMALLTKSCEDAAVFMISACRSALEEGALLDNMCLLQ
jgi:hypothetical protein